LKYRISNILLLLVFITAILQPAIPFVQYYISLGQETVIQDQACNCSCYHKTEDPTNPDTGDAYLKALLKRVCNDKKKEAPKLPAVNISVFVKTLYSPNIPVYICPEQNYTEISDFIILPHTGSHIVELFRPPRLS